MTRQQTDDLSDTITVSEGTRERLAEILDDYLHAAEQGSPMSNEELLANHPEYAADLKDYLSGLELIRAAAESPRFTPSALEFRLNGTLSDGHTIADYRLRREIGRGGMGVVYEAEQQSLRRRVALKVLPFASAQDSKQISRFRHEAQAAAQIEHSAIVPVYHVGYEDGVHFYTMQLIDGRPLSEMIQEWRSESDRQPQDTTLTDIQQPTVADKCGSDAGESTLPSSRPINSPERYTQLGADHFARVAEFGAQAAEALHAAHEHGVVHRDIKPSNLLVDRDGKLWITDFGLARCRENPGLTLTGDLVGTMLYMSPEQAAGRGELVDHRTDIYSLGVTLYQLATLQHPMEEVSKLAAALDRKPHKPLRHWNKRVPIDLQTIVMKAMSELPHERYASAADLADDLQRFLAGEPIHASPPRLATRAAKWAQRHRPAVFAASFVLAMGFCGLIFSNLYLTRANAEKEEAIAEAKLNLDRTHLVLDRFSSRLVDQLALIPGAAGSAGTTAHGLFGAVRRI